jgi:hypothetical protein
MTSNEDGGQPFSMHARGVSAMDSATYLDFSYQMRSALKEVRYLNDRISPTHKATRSLEYSDRFGLIVL